ncbi:MAG: tetratricopeptide repeat-containing protein, partial [Planctomycetota bacterium]
MKIHCGLVFVFATLQLTAFAQEPGRSSESPTLQPLFHDGFREDTRSNYTIEGNASWKPSKLTLAEGGSIARLVEGSYWFTTELDFGGNDWTRSTTGAELRVRFSFDGASDCLVRLQSNPRADAKDSLAIIDTAGAHGQIIEEVVREVSLPQDVGQRIEIEYRLGLITIRQDQSPLLTAYIDNSAATLRAARVESVAGTMSFRLWKVSSLPAAAPFTEEQQRRIAAAKLATGQLAAYQRKGQFAEAAKLGEQALAIRKEVLGVEHPDYADSLNNLAGLSLMMGDYGRAESLFEKAIEVQGRLLGDAHPDFAITLGNLAGLHQKMGDYDRAEPRQRQSCEIFRKVLGVDNFYYATGLNSLGELYRSMGRYDEAESSYLQSRDIRKRLFGEEHPSYSTILCNLAQLYQAKGDYVRAERHFIQTLEIDRKTLGEEHPYFAESLNNLAVLYITLCEYEQAERLFKQAHRLYRKLLGDEHPSYATSLYNLASLYQQMGRYDRAERLYLQALESRRKLLGEKHPSYAQSLSKLARLYQLMGEYARA